jgi:hypothetical protein
MLALRGGIEFAYRVPRGQLSFGMQTAPVQCNEQVIDRSGPVVVRAPARRQLPAALDSRRPDILLLVEIASMNLVSSSTASPWRPLCMSARTSICLAGAISAFSAITDRAFPRPVHY